MDRMEDLRPDPDKLLADLKQEEGKKQRGKLKIFFGYAAGVGKTYAMLDSALNAKSAGEDIVLGYIEPHARPETMQKTEGLEKIPVQKIDYNGITLSEFDLDTALRRRPKIILVDELAHFNAQGSRHKKRWQDVEELLAAGIDVYTTLNVQHIESLNDIVSSITQINVRETVPDHVFDQADQVELIDIEPADLIKRLGEGKVYIEKQAKVAVQSFFTERNLIALREVAMRRCADRIFNITKGQRRKANEEVWATMGETVMACLSPSESNAHILRSASRIAEAFHAHLTALYVETPERRKMGEEEQKRLRNNMELAERLGARVVTVQGEDIAQQIEHYARVRNISRIVIGKNHRNAGYHRFFSPDIADKIIAASPYIDVYVIPEQSTKRARRWLHFYSPNWRFTWRDILIVLFGLLLTTLVGLLFQRFNFSESNIIILYLLCVLGVSNRTKGHLPGILCSILAVFTFNFFFTEPYYSLQAFGAYYPVTFPIMLIAALITTTLTTRIRNQAHIYAVKEKTTELLLQTSRVLMFAHNRDALSQAIAEHLKELFSCSAFCYLPSQEEPDTLPIPSVAAYDSDTSVNILFESSEQAVASWVFANAKEAGRGTNTLPSSKGYYFPILGENKALAVIGILCMDSANVSIEQRRILRTVGGQIALVIERVILYEAEQQARSEVEREQLRSNLLRAVSHDLRTPLTGISGAASTLLDNGDMLDDQTRKQLLHSICDDSEWLIQLVENLLSVTRIDEGRLQLKKREEVVEEVVSEAVEHIEKHLKKHPLRIMIDENVGLVPMDGKLIEQVLMNLIENAIKYTPPETEITLKVRIEKKEAIFEVSDKGAGIAEKDIPHLFDRFFTKGDTASDSRRGIGLGLSISKSIINAHGGEITVYNASTGGAVFRFTLPM